MTASDRPTLEALGLEAEALSALGLLRGVLETRQLSTASLERLRAALGRSLGAPAL
ncbi:MAG: hypothetical protein HC897_19105 [Thermoanaerobaculia bacterium]|nr:hypothetical protein [Thermoanaerobaculia bacterium]